METVVSGIRPTGNLHLGNYFGAVKNFLKLQNNYNCYFFIADYHSLTTHPTPTDLSNNVTQVLSEYLAVGLDPEKVTLYIQSDLTEISELYLLLNMNAYIGELERTTSFKEKVRKQPQNINAGLLTYPTLMAADILIHKGTKIPVGKDQEQNLEMVRKFAKRFNRMYDVNYFSEPQAFNFGEELIKVPGLDGTGKMGKSDGNGIFLIDNQKIIHKKVMSAVTDSGPTTPNSSKTEAIENLFTLMKIISSNDTLNYFEQEYNNCKIRYGDMKKQLVTDINKFVLPIREKIIEIKDNKKYLSEVVKLGKEKAKKQASKTLREIREIIGFKQF